MMPLSVPPVSGDTSVSCSNSTDDLEIAAFDGAHPLGVAVTSAAD